MRRRSIVPALILILIGVWFLVRNLGVNLPDMDVMWPIFPMGAGLLFLGGYVLNRRDPGLVFVGLAATLIGAFFFLFTLRIPLPIVGMQEGVRWSDMDRLWPAFVVIGGLAFIALFVAEARHDWAVFTLGAVAVLVGCVAFLFTFGWLAGDIGLMLLKLWPLLLVVMGVAALLQALLRPRQKN
jgi:hypothetical protein